LYSIFYKKKERLKKMTIQQKIQEKIQKYWKEKSLWAKISDVVFILLLIGLLIPASRMEIVVFVKQLTSFSPKAIEAQERKSVTAEAYDWVLETEDGKVMNMSDFKGKTLFINQWATWCPPCVAEMPSIQKLYEQVKDNQNIVFIIVTNEDKQTALNFIKKKKYTFPIMIARSQAPKAFETESIPVTFLVSPKGEIVLKEYGSRKWHGKETVDLMTSLK